jgi:hypothetical protein
MSFTIHKAHICQVLSQAETQKALYSHGIRKRVEESNDNMRLIIRNTRVDFSSDAAAGISQNEASERTIECI